MGTKSNVGNVFETNVSAHTFPTNNIAVAMNLLVGPLNLQLTGVNSDNLDKCQCRMWDECHNRP